MKNQIDLILAKLQMSKFRSNFKLSLKDKLYIKEKGLDVIKSHAEEFVKKRLKDPSTFCYGKQTPMKILPNMPLQLVVESAWKNGITYLVITSLLTGK